MKPLLLMLYTLMLTASAYLQANTTDASLFSWPAVSGKTNFVQVKTLQGLPVPLQSNGVIVIESDQLLWHTKQPVDQQLLISKDGVSQWQQQQYNTVAGSQFVGQLMLAVMQRDLGFLQQHFTFGSEPEHCTLLTPTQAPLNQLFSGIHLCGRQQLDNITLTELNGNITHITLQPQAEQ